MKQIEFNKEFIKEYTSVVVVFENCDEYEIDVADILEFKCQVKILNKKNKIYLAEKGLIKISKRASLNLEFEVRKQNQVGVEWDVRFLERLQSNQGGDVTHLIFKKETTEEYLEIELPYEPLEEVLHGNPIEFSNCASMEFDESGDIVVLFGEFSKKPKRVDNDYSNLVKGWKEFFNNYQPKVLKVKITHLSLFGGDKKMLLCWCDIKDKNSPKDYVDLVFVDCKNFGVELFFNNIGREELVMSKMADGRIYVGFERTGIEFTCANVLEYEHYNNSNK